MSLIFHLVNRIDFLTRMKDGYKDYKSMLPCYYVEKIDEVKECAEQSFALITIQKYFFQKTDRCYYL